MSPAEQQMLVRSTQAWTFSEHSCTSVPCALFNSFTPIPWILFLVNGRQMSKERMTIKGEKLSGRRLAKYTWGAGAGGPQVQGLPELQCEFKSTLGNLVRPYLKQ